MTLAERIIVIIASVMAVAVIGILVIQAGEYKRADKEYENLQQYVSTGNSAQKVGGVAPIVPETKVEEEVKELPRNYNRSDFPDIEVDFDSLLEINKDTVGWLYVGACEISYPVVQGEDNEYYMHMTFENNQNSAGSIIMDYRDNNQLEDWNTFIYGHNMKNGSMFGTLKKFIYNEGLRDTDPYIYMFIPGYIYRYKIFSFFIDEPDSKMYWTADNLQQYRQYIRDAKEKAVVKYDDYELNEDINMITLVTCSGMGAGKKRFFVQGAFVDRYVFE